MRWIAATSAGVGAAVMVILIGVLALTGVVGRRSTILERVAVPGPTGKRDPASIVEVARRVRPTIVTIDVSGAISGSGSGVVVRSDGYILTNAHVISGATAVDVEMPSGRTVNARIIGSDAETDIGVVKIDVGEVDVATLGTATGLEVGDVAIAIGSPFGLSGGPSVTVGVISALGRNIPVEGRQLLDMIQTDAPIAPGSSGGALLDENGSVIGITTAGAQDGAGSLGFATPIDIARRVATQLIDTGRVEHPLIGIEGRTIDQAEADRLGATGGAVVSAVQRSTPAEAAGLRVGDVIVAIDGRTVRGVDDLTVGLRGHSPGDRVTLVLVRDGARRTVTLTLGRRS